MPLPENPNLEDARENQDPGNEFEQNEGQDTGNEIIDNSEPDVTGLNAASLASEPSFTLNVEDDYAPAPEKDDEDGQALKH